MPLNQWKINQVTPDISVFYADGKVRDYPLGWYHWRCILGCLPSSKAIGPFISYEDARKDAISKEEGNK